MLGKSGHAKTMSSNYPAREHGKAFAAAAICTKSEAGSWSQRGAPPEGNEQDESHRTIGTQDSDSVSVKQSSFNPRSNGDDATCCGVRMERFSDAKSLWVTQHNQISCQHDQDTVVLFRACCQHLGPHATATGSFRGSPCYEKDRTRMMWFDTSFLVSMRKSCWGTKPGREVVLAIWVKRSFLEDCLSVAVCSDTFGPSAPAHSSAAAATAAAGGAGAGRGGDRPKPVRSLRARVGSGTSSSLGSEASFSSPRNRSDVSIRPSAADEFFAIGRTAMADSSDSPFDAVIATGEQDVKDAGGVHHEVSSAQDSEEEEDGPRVDAAEIYRGKGADEMPLQRRLVSSQGRDELAFESEHSTTASGSGGTSAGGPGGEDARSQILSCSTSNGNTAGNVNAVVCGAGKRMTDGVRLHWEPERLPSGEKHRTRRVVQLGLKGTWLQALGSGDAVVKIQRLDDLLTGQRMVLESTEPQLLMVPVSRPLDCGHLTDAKVEELNLVRARPKLRILCLHGYLQNSQSFSQKTRQLCKKLRSCAELVYVDAPHLLAPEELPPPRVPLLASPRAQAAEAAARAAQAAAAKVVITGEGGAPGRKTISSTMDDGDDGTSSYLPPQLATGAVATDNTCTVMPMPGVTVSDAVETATVRTGAAVPPVSSQTDREGARTWWRCDAEERRIAKAIPGMSGRCEWKGLEESLTYLCDIWDEQGPFDGILGFSQGAAMASIFNHCVFGSAELRDEGAVSPENAHEGGGNIIQEASRLLPGKIPISPPPSFAVFVSGCYQPHPTQVPSYPLPQEAEQEPLPSLHVWAVQDPFVPASQSQRLASMYLRSSVLMHRGSHYVPQSKEVVPHFVRFLEEFR